MLWSVTSPSGAISTTLLPFHTGLLYNRLLSTNSAHPRCSPYRTDRFRNSSPLDPCTDLVPMEVKISLTSLLLPEAIESTHSPLPLESGRFFVQSIQCLLVFRHLLYGIHHPHNLLWPSALLRRLDVLSIKKSFHSHQAVFSCSTLLSRFLTFAAVVCPASIPSVESFMNKIFTVAKQILKSSTILGCAIYMRSISSLS